MNDEEEVEVEVEVEVEKEPTKYWMDKRNWVWVERKTGFGWTELVLQYSPSHMWIL
jgi:hypothetical protein